MKRTFLFLEAKRAPFRVLVQLGANLYVCDNRAISGTKSVVVEDLGEALGLGIVALVHNGLQEGTGLVVEDAIAAARRARSLFTTINKYFTFKSFKMKLREWSTGLKGAKAKVNSKESDTRQESRQILRGK
jgi:hypothetical protein